MKIQRQSSAKVNTAKGPKSVQEYLKDLDILLKRNTGSGTFQGQDVSSNIPMYLPGKVVNPGGIGEAAPSIAQYGNGMTQPARVQREAPLVYEEPQQEQPVTIDEFLQQFEQSYNAPENQQPFGDPQLEFIASTPDGGSLMADGTIVYDDGTIRMGDPNAVAIRSNVDGSIGYSDGSSRKLAPEAIRSVMGNRERIGYDDGSIRYGQYLYGDGQPVSTPGGLQGLISGIFGQDRTITQEYGNINPIEPTAGNVNLGTDIRTRDLQGDQRGYKLPVDAEVVQVYQDDGTRYGDISGHKGYGNSVLVRLKTGEMLRFSHLSQLGNFQPGQTIKAGEVFGTPGATGNTTGEHLDLEYYNAQGQISNPSQFTGFSDPQGLRSPLPGQPAPGTLDRGQEQPQMSQAQPQQPQVSYPGQTINENIVQPAVSAAKQAAQSVPQNRQELGQAVEKASPVKAEFGLGETIAQGPEAGQQARISALSQQPKQYNPYRQLVGNIFERAGDTLGVPEGTLSEVIAGGPTKRTNQALAAEIGGEQPAQVPGIRQNIKDIGTDITQKAESALSQAGEGIRSLGQSGLASLENVFRPQQSTIKRAVGDVAGTGIDPAKTSSLMAEGLSLADLGKNDIRDPFFKSGAASQYQSLLKPGAVDTSGGALSLDLFKDEFYQNPSNIKNVFGGTFLEAGAKQKLADYEEQQRKIEEEKQRNRPTLQDYLNQGKTVAQYYAETGQQSSLDQLGKQGYDVRTNNNPEGAQGFSGGNPVFAPTDYGQVTQQGQQTGQGVQSYTYPSGRTVTATPGTSLRTDSSGGVQRVDNKSATLPNGRSVSFATPTSQPSAQLNQQPRKNVFSNVFNFASNIFRR